MAPTEDDIPPAVPDNLRLVEASPSFITLVWVDVVRADLYCYEVYRSNSASGSYITLANVLAPITFNSNWDVTANVMYIKEVVAVILHLKNPFILASWKQQLSRVVCS